MEGQMSGLPAAWLAELDDQVALLHDPDGRAAVLEAMAFAGHRRGGVATEQRPEMLEFVEAGRLWGLVEGEARM